MQNLFNVFVVDGLKSKITNYIAISNCHVSKYSFVE